MKTNASTRFLLLCGLFAPFSGTLEASLTSESTASDHRPTETCIEHMKYARKFMSTAAHPCVNFGEYVCSPPKETYCGRSPFQHPGSYSERWVRVQKEIMGILRESGSGDFTEANEAAIAYQCCMNEDSSFELDNLRELLKDRGIPDWPMTQRSREEYHIEDSMDAITLEAFFHFQAVQDASDPTKYMLLVTQPSFPVVYPGVLSNLRSSGEQEIKLSVKKDVIVKDMEQPNKPRDTEASGATISHRRSEEPKSNNPKTVGETLGSREMLISDAYQSYAEKVIQKMKRIPSLHSREIAKEIVVFESHLAKFAEASSNAVEKSPIHVNLRQLIDKYYNESTPATLLKRYLQRNGVPIDDSMNIYIAEPKYFELVFSFIETARRYQVKNYEGWKVIASLAHLVAPVRLLHQEFMHFFELQKKNKEETCAAAIAGKGSPLEGLVYRAYVERKFPFKAKKDVEQMTAFIQEEMEAMLSRSKWSSGYAREQALAKVKNLAKQIGYPAWIDNKGRKVRSFSRRSSFIRVLEDYRKATLENSMRKLSSRFSYENEWSGTPLDVTFGYDSSSNLLFLPAGFLQPPLYSVDLPEAVNYGTVGLMVAQEMVRAFLKGSVGYGLDSNSRACLKETLKMYIERTYLLRGAFSDSSTEQDLLKNNEELDEDNYVDKKAIELAWKAFLQHTKKSSSKTNTLDLGKNITQEKLFFISVGLTLCIIKPHYSMETKIHETYSEESRINRLLKDMPSFLEAFDCKAKH
ncbi:neprilysin-1-like isoform X3 [Haemaphysalis longicornis]